MGLEILPGVETVDDLPAIYIRGLKAVALADAHIGFEEEAAAKGIYIPRIQGLRALEATRRAVEATGAQWVIFVGDIKHSFSRLLRTEREELQKLFDFLASKISVRVTVVRGNHDNYLPLVARRYGVEVVDELYAEGILFIHGHRKPVEPGLGPVKLIVMGHEHPSLRLRDRLGFVAKLPAFLVAPLKTARTKVVVLPAVGQYQTGTTVSLDPSTYLSPILREDVDLKEVRPYVLAEGLGVLEFPELGLLEDLLDVA
ncbi:MAG: metallophosphoesterase [Thermoproteota archaeon]